MKLRYAGKRKCRLKAAKESKRGSTAIRAAALGVALAVAPGLVGCKDNVDKDKTEKVDKQNDKDDKKELSKQAQKELNDKLAKAVEGGDMKKVAELLGSGADANTKTRGINIIWLALANEETEIAKELIENGADTNVKSTTGKTMLEYSAHNGQDEMVKFLLETESYQASKKELEDCMHIAVGNSNLKMSELILEKGADVDSKDSKGNTILWEMMNNPDMLKLFIEYGADVNTKNNKGVYLLSAIASHGYVNTVKELLKTEKIEQDVKDAALMDAVSGNSEDIVKALLEHGADVNAKDIYGETVIWKALNSKKINIVELLVEKEADLGTKDRYGNTLLWKTYARNMGLFELFVKNGADVNEKNSKGEVLIVEAVDDRYLTLVELLVEYGADQELKNAKGINAVEMAKKRHNQEMIDALGNAKTDSKVDAVETEEDVVETNEEEKPVKKATGFKPKKKSVEGVGGI